jgi:type II secretory pathway component GspD/PulD (secretin)
MNQPPPQGNANRPGGNNQPPRPGLAETISSVLTAGTATIVPDARLNRLFVQGTATDIAMIEAHLQIIDRATSLAEVKTHGRPQMIELQHTRASEIADILRDVYGDRVAKSSSPERQNANQRPQENQPAQQNQNQQPNQPAAGGQKRAAAEPVMTIAVDERSNSIVVTAPEQLYEEVKTLTLALDERGVQGVRVLRLTNPRSVKDALREIFRDRIQLARPTGRR